MAPKVFSLTNFLVVTVIALLAYIFQPIPWMASTSMPQPLPIFIIRAVTADLLLKASRAVMPSTIVGVGDSAQFMLSMSLGVACKRKFADLISDSAVDASDLAQKAGLDAGHTQRLLVFLQANGYLCVELLSKAWPSLANTSCLRLLQRHV